VSQTSKAVPNTQQNKNPDEKDRPKPVTQSSESVHPIYNDPTLIESYVQDLVHEALSKERITMSPQGNAGNMYTPNGIQSDEGDPEVTDTDILDQLLTRFGNEEEWKTDQPMTSVDPLIKDAKNDLFDQYNEPDQDFLVNDTRDKAGNIDSPYPSGNTGDLTPLNNPQRNVDAGGVPIQTPDDPQRTSVYGDALDNPDDADRRRKIGEMLSGRRR
tara:strand:- start:734 stop:1378 length:645 start_codon:yes stop_codon:yes gene_type:complete